MVKKPWIYLSGVLLGLGACGDTASQQGLVGAGAGAATAVILDGSPFTGAVLGAAGNLLYCQTNPGQCS